MIDFQIKMSPSGMALVTIHLTIAIGLYRSDQVLFDGMEWVFFVSSIVFAAISIWSYISLRNTDSSNDSPELTFKRENVRVLSLFFLTATFPLLLAGVLGITGSPERLTFGLFVLYLLSGVIALVALVYMVATDPSSKEEVDASNGLGEGEQNRNM